MLYLTNLDPLFHTLFSARLHLYLHRDPQVKLGEPDKHHSPSFIVLSF